MKFFLFIAVLLCFNFSFAEENVTNKAEKIFEAVHEKIMSKLPSSFYGRLKGKNIEKNLKNIPKSSYIDKKKDVFVEVVYSKKDGVNFIVKNVDELYKDMYKNLSRQIFAFDLLLSKTNADLLKKYEIILDYESESTTVLKLRIKNSENKIAIYIDNKTVQILRVDYEMGNDLINSTIIMYAEIDKYSIPFKFITKSFNKGTSTVPDIYEIGNIQIK